MNILVTGHLGFIGSYLIKELKKKKKWNVIGLDIKDGDDITQMVNFPRVDLVYHLAAQTDVMNSLTNPYEDADKNIMMTIKLLKAYPNAKFVFTSSGGAIQDAIASPYGLSKKTCEEYIKMLHKNYVICRLANVYGIGGHGVLEKWKDKNIIKIYGDGHSTRDYVHVSDIVKGLILARNWEKGTYSLGTGNSIDILDLAEQFGKPIRFGEERKGELRHSRVLNTTPDWKPTYSIKKYIYEICNM